MEWLLDDIRYIILTLIVSSIVVIYLRKITLFLVKRHYSSSQKLKVPFLDLKKLKNDLYIETKYQNTDPAKLSEPRHNQVGTLRGSLKDYFIKEVFKDKVEDAKYFMILGDTGLGKTTFLINLLYKYLRKPSLLGKFPFKYSIKFYPLSRRGLKQYIESINVEDQFNSILLLDAFDEDLAAIKDPIKRINEIVTITKSFKYILITSRSQFFIDTDSIPLYTQLKKSDTKKGLYLFKSVFISPFTDEEIRKYVKEKFPFYKKNKRKKALSIIAKTPDLMARPMLLSHIEDLLDINEERISIYSIYNLLIEKWIDRETSIYGGEQVALKTTLYKFCQDLTLAINDESNSDQEFQQISHNKVSNLISKYNIETLSFTNSAKTLLNRNVDNMFKFSHKSIYEFMLANLAFHDFNLFLNIEWKANSFGKGIFEYLSSQEPNIAEFLKNFDRSNIDEVAEFTYQLKDNFTSFESIKKLIAFDFISFTSIDNQIISLRKKVNDNHLKLIKNGVSMHFDEKTMFLKSRNLDHLNENDRSIAQKIEKYVIRQNITETLKTSIAPLLRKFNDP